MPWKAKKPCSRPGCGRLTHERFCEAHRRMAKQEIEEGREHAARRGYNYAWQQLRKRVLAEEPLCRFCGEKGRITAAKHVDHIDGNARNNARENLRPLCASCHNARTARDQAFGRKQAKNEKTS